MRSGRPNACGSDSMLARLERVFMERKYMLGMLTFKDLPGTKSLWYVRNCDD